MDAEGAGRDESSLRLRRHSAGQPTIGSPLGHCRRPRASSNAGPDGDGHLGVPVGHYAAAAAAVGAADAGVGADFVAADCAGRGAGCDGRGAGEGSGRGAGQPTGRSASSSRRRRRCRWTSDIRRRPGPMHQAKPGR